MPTNPQKSLLSPQAQTQPLYCCTGYSLLCSQPCNNCNIGIRSRSGKGWVARVCQMELVTLDIITFLYTFLFIYISKLQDSVFQTMKCVIVPSTSENAFPNASLSPAHFKPN